MNSKVKGSKFERDICKLLSLWVTAGVRQDVFWRSAMSGGRATVRGRQGVDVRQMGDVCAVAPEGHVLTDRYYIECKHLRSLDLDRFVLGEGKLITIWRSTEKLAQARNRTPLVIARGNRTPILWVCNHLPRGVNNYCKLANGYHLVYVCRLDDVLRVRWKERDDDIEAAALQEEPA